MRCVGVAGITQKAQHLSAAHAITGFDAQTARLQVRIESKTAVSERKDHVVEAPISRPCGWSAIPAIQLFFKNLLCTAFADAGAPLFGIVLGKQVDRWLKPQIVQA